MVGSGSVLPCSRQTELNGSLAVCSGGIENIPPPPIPPPPSPPPPPAPPPAACAPPAAPPAPPAPPPPPRPPPPPPPNCLNTGTATNESGMSTVTGLLVGFSM